MKKSEQPPAPKKKYPIYFYFVLSVFPILFFVFLELGLRWFEYGESIPQWIKFPYGKEDKIILNTSIAKRYFHTGKLIPNPWSDPFDREKKPNTFRVFVLGESSTAGYPYDLKAAFSGEVKRRLMIAYPNNRIEVVNFGIAAINSYTLYDLLDGFIEQQPDLFLIYTGHNEYYGALGVGSSESIGNQRWLVRTVIELERFRTVQLIRQFITSIMMLGQQPSDSRKTLMESMVKEQLIPLGSDLYTSGINQFTENMELILSTIKASGVPVIVSNLTSNLSGQKPFISEPYNGLPAANIIFQKAVQSKKEGNYSLAYAEFLSAKELDMLRFRAPNKFNEIIRDLSLSYNLPFVDMDSIFRANSPNGIPGDNLFIDHLHPNMPGYRLMGKSFFEMMIKGNLTPDHASPNLTVSQLDSLANIDYPITSLDTLAAFYNVTRLKAGWPFIDTKDKMKDPFENYEPKNLTESLALKISNLQINIEDAHFTLAMKAKDEKNTELFMTEMKAVIAGNPEFSDNYEIVSVYLINAGQLNRAVPYLQKVKTIKNNDFSNKWLGIISFINKEYSKSADLLETAIATSPNDAQTLYNLSGAYLYTGQLNKSFETISKCLLVNQDFPGAKEFYNDMKRKLKQ